MNFDFFFYATAIPAVFLIGLSKGGFGGMMALLGVPILSLGISPLHAAAILLPVLLFMDAVALFLYRNIYDKVALKILLPSCFIGILVGWALFHFVNDDHVRLLIGVLGLWFLLFQGLKTFLLKTSGGRHNVYKGAFWGVIAGFTSFVAHAGSSGFQAYMLPLGLAPRVLAGSGVFFFAFANVVKLVPYYALDLLSIENLRLSLTLLPVALFSTILGAYLVKIIPVRLFYGISYVTLFIASIKVLFDGVSGLGWLSA